MFTRLACLFAMALALTACGRSQTAADLAAADGILLVGNGSEPRTLDPAINTGVPERIILDALFEGLTTVDPDDPGGILPGAAASWSANADFTEWTFELQPEGRWSDGTPVTARDFVFAWTRTLTPELGAENAEMLFPLKNARAFNRGDVGADMLGVRAVGDHTLIVDLEWPTPGFVRLAATYPWFPLNKASIETAGSVTDRTSPWTRAGSLISNGPFMLADWQTNTVLELARNPYYWDEASLRLSGVKFFPVENEQSEEAMFRAGQLHATSTIPVDKQAQYVGGDNPAFRSEPMLGTYFLRVNTTRPALSKGEVREALSLAIDRELLVSKALGGGQEPAGGFVAAGFNGFDTPPALPFDPDRARRLLAEAGFPGGKGFPPVEILINTSESHRKIAQVVQAMWSQNLGIEASVVNQEWKVYLDTVDNLDYDIARGGWIAPYHDPFAFLYIMTSTDPYNSTGWSSADYDRLIETARTAPDEGQRIEAMEQANLILRDELPLIPLYYYRSNYLLDPRVKGWNPDPQRRHPLKYVYFADG